jgi:hypothetical protein
MKTLQGLGMLAVSTLLFVEGCAVSAEEGGPDRSESSAGPEATPLTSIGASEDTNRQLGIARFEVHELEAGRLKIEALSEAGKAQGIFEVARLAETGVISPTVEGTRRIEYTVSYPVQGKRTIEPGSDAVLESTLDSSSYGGRLIEAFSADIAGIAPGTTFQSTAPSLDPQYLICMTDTKCYGVVLWCKDKCCNAYDEIKRKWVECTTISQYPCGACIGFPW